MLDAGVRDVRNQGVLLNGVNADPHALLDLCFTILDGRRSCRYFCMCDMIPFSEHWRVSVADAQRLQHHIMGYLPGFRHPAHRATSPSSASAGCTSWTSYDTERGISYWTKNYRTSIEATGRGRPHPDLRVLRPDPHPPGRRPGQGRRRRPRRRAALKGGRGGGGLTTHRGPAANL